MLKTPSLKSSHITSQSTMTSSSTKSLTTHDTFDKSTQSYSTAQSKVQTSDPLQDITGSAKKTSCTADEIYASYLLLDIKNGTNKVKKAKDSLNNNILKLNLTKTIKKNNSFGIPSYKKTELTILYGKGPIGKKTAEGAWIVDKSGKEQIDGRVCFTTKKLSNNGSIIKSSQYKDVTNPNFPVEFR